MVRKPRRDSAFKHDHRVQRLRFANGYANFDWNKVLWSDEKTFWLINRNNAWVIRGVGEAHEQKFMLPHVRHPPKLHVWACFSESGLGNLVCFTENMDAALYVTILQQNLLQSARRLFGDGVPFWFQQDNDPKHTSARAKRWLHNNGVQLIDWPPCSPDLNPIENLWADLNRRVELHHAKTIEELQSVIRTEWKNTSRHTLQQLVRSMPDRCAAVLQAAGSTTAY